MKRVKIINKPSLKKAAQAHLHVSLPEVVADRVEVDKADVGVCGGHVRPGDTDDRPEEDAHVEPGLALLRRVGVPAMTDHEDEEGEHLEEDGQLAEEEPPPHGHGPVVPRVHHLQTEAVGLGRRLAAQHREGLQPAELVLALHGTAEVLYGEGHVH